MPDPLGGWGTLILQGGAFALLVYIIAIMYPKETEAGRKERIERDTAFIAALTSMELKADVRNDRMVAALERQTTSLQVSIDKNGDQMRSAVSTVCKNSLMK